MSLFAVVAESQSAGRGTRGRSWISGEGNLLLTVAIRVAALPPNLPLTLAPLRIGSLVGSALAPLVSVGGEGGSRLRLKWPNDVLLDGLKVSGVLMELQGDFLLVGVGVNVVSSPPVSPTGPHKGRPATHLAAHNPLFLRPPSDPLPPSPFCEGGEEAERVWVSDDKLTFTPPHSPSLQDQGQEGNYIKEGDFHKLLAVDICSLVKQWVESGDDTAELVVADFQRNMDFSIQTLRDFDEKSNKVLPLMVNLDGTLKVSSVFDNYS
jgi:hypothetical protein